MQQRWLCISRLPLAIYRLVLFTSTLFVTQSRLSLAAIFVLPWRWRCFNPPLYSEYFSIDSNPDASSCKQLSECGAANAPFYIESLLSNFQYYVSCFFRNVIMWLLLKNLPRRRPCLVSLWYVWCIYLLANKQKKKLTLPRRAPYQATFIRLIESKI